MATGDWTTIIVALRFIWIRPRAAIRAIVEAGAPGATILAALFGLVVAISIVAQNPNLARSEMFDFVALMLGAFTGIGWFYLLGALLRRAGSWLGGSANGRAVRAVVAYSQIPVLLSEALLVFSHFMGERPDTPSSGFSLVLELIGVGLMIWSLPIFFTGLAEVHGFSIWKALSCTGISLAGLIAAYLLFLGALFLAAALVHFTRA